MTNQNTYNQPAMGEQEQMQLMGMPPQEPMMPAQQMPSQRAIMPSMQNRQRMVNRMDKMPDAFPKWLSQYSVAVYLLALMVVTFMYSAYSMPWYYMLSGVVAVTVFFLYGSKVVSDTTISKIRREKNFEKRIFWLAFVFRATWMVLIYTIFMQAYGDAFGFERADAYFYDDIGRDYVTAINNGSFTSFLRQKAERTDISDIGYGVYVGLVYWLTGSSIWVVRLLKCTWSAMTVVLLYRLTKRNFGDQTARVATIFCALWPNFWYYCGTHLKETEMVFLAVLFVEQADQMLRSRNFTAWKVMPVLLVGALLLTIRTPLALVAFLSLIFSVVMSSAKVVDWGKRIIVGGLAIALIGVVAGNRIQEEARELMDTVQSGQQQSNLEWRGKRTNGNAFAKYAGKSVFAPLIFTIPFSSMVRPFDGQEQQQINNGGNFIKNIISFFTIFAMFLLLISGKWREHLLPISFMLGYLAVLTMSTFAQSERFHQPAMPFEFMFAAYGLSIAVTKPKYKRWFTYWCALMFIACLAWNWFKLKGRGL